MNDGQNSGLERGVDVGKALGLETSASSKEQREQEPDGQGDDDLLVSQEAESLAPEGLSTKEKKGIVRFFIKFGQALEGLDAAIDKIGEGQEEKRIKWAAEKKKEAREWWQLDRKGKFFKGKGEGAKITRIALGCVGTVITVAVCAGVSGLLIRSWELGRAQREIESSGVDVPAEQKKQEIASQQEQSFEADYLRYAKNGLPDEDGDIYQGFSPPGLDNAAHILNSDVQIQTAMRGPSWNFAMYPNEAGVLQTNDLLVERVAAQLGVSPADLKAEWPDLNTDPAYALQYLQAHGANATVTNFYQCTTDVYNSDLDKTTWQDRVPAVQACSASSSSLEGREKLVKTEIYQPDENFESAVEIVTTATGTDFACVRGSMETLMVCGGNVGQAVEMVDSYAHRPDIHTSLAHDMEISMSAYALLPLFLLRIGQHSVQGLKTRIKDWIDRGEIRKMTEILAKIGQESWLGRKSA